MTPGDQSQILSIKRIQQELIDEVFMLYDSIDTLKQKIKEKQAELKKLDHSLNNLYPDDNQCTGDFRL